jgi:hypothetical protein
MRAFIEQGLFFSVIVVGVGLMQIKKLAGQHPEVGKAAAGGIVKLISRLLK